MSTSLQTFRNHLRYLTNGKVDASQIHSRECYLEWITARSTKDCESECKKFQRSLSNHVSGVDGRSPFEPEEEAAILDVLRQKKSWPCFPAELRIGSMGYRSRGYHEKNRESAAAAGGRHQPPHQPYSRKSSTPPLASALPPPPPLPSLPLLSLPPLPQPPPPATHSPPTLLQELDKFAQHVAQYSTTFATFNIDVSTSIYGLFSLFCEAKLIPAELRRRNGPAYARRMELCSSPVYAEQLCSTLALEHGQDCCVTVYSLGSDYGKRIVAQNAHSKRVLGDFSQTAAGESSVAVAPRLVPAHEWGNLVMGLGLAYSNPGVCVPTVFHYPAGAFHCQLYVDPSSLLNCSMARRM